MNNQFTNIECHVGDTLSAMDIARMEAGNSLPSQGKRTRFSARVLLAGVGMATFAVATGCSGDSETTLNSVPAVAESSPLNADQQAVVDELCETGFDMKTSLDEEFAESNVGGVDSLMNRFTEVNEAGETVPVAPEVFADKLLDEVCKKPTVLAAVTAFMIEPAGLNNGKAVAPNASSMSRVKELAELYRGNEQAAFEAIRTLASVVKAPNGAELVDNFSVIENQGTRIVPNRAEGKVTGLITEQITVGDLFTGYLFNYAKEGLDDKQIADQEAVRTLVMIGKDGEMIIRVWIGDQFVDIEQVEESPETTTVQTTVDTTGATQPQNTSENDKEGQTPTGTTVVTDGTTPTGTTPSNGTTAATTGGGGNQPSPTPSDNGCNGNANPGCEGGDEDGPEVTNPSTTTTPRATTTTTPRSTTTIPRATTTTTTPRSTTTIPATTTSSTTTTTTTIPRATTTTSSTTTTTTPVTTSSQPWKPPVDCDPAIDVCN